MPKLKPKLLQTLFVIFIVIATVFYFRSKVLPPEVPRGADYASLAPGISTKQEAIEKLGGPLNSPEAEVLFFKSNNPNLPHEVHTNENTVSFIKEVVAPDDNKTSDQIKQLYGNANFLLYGLGANSGFALYIYPDKGIAYVGHFKEPVLLEIWYFPPTTFQEFRVKWAPDYTLSPIPMQ